MTAYIAGGSSMLIDILNIKNTIKSSLIFIIPFASIMFLGINFVDQINKILFIGLIVSYLFLIFKVNTTQFQHFINLNFLNYKMTLFSLPIIITSFGYNLLIPSLKTYLLNNVRLIIIAILIGSLIPLIIYILWEYLITFFFLTVGNKLFIKTLFGDGNPTEKIIIIMMSCNKNILYFISIFSFFALTSSLIGVALSIYDFFFDMLKMRKNSIKNKSIVLLLVFTAPIILNIIYPYGFMLALSYAGVFASILLIIFPTYVLWYGRYIKKIKYNYILLNSKLILSILLYLGLLIIFIDIIEKFYFQF